MIVDFFFFAEMRLDFFLCVGLVAVVVDTKSVSIRFESVVFCSPVFYIVIIRLLWAESAVCLFYANGAVRCTTMHIWERQTTMSRITCICVKFLRDEHTHTFQRRQWTNNMKIKCLRLYFVLCFYFDEMRCLVLVFGEAINQCIRSKVIYYSAWKCIGAKSNVEQKRTHTKTVRVAFVAFASVFLRKRSFETGTTAHWRSLNDDNEFH